MGLGELVFNAVFDADAVENVFYPSGSRPVALLWQIGESRENEDVG